MFSGFNAEVSAFASETVASPYVLAGYCPNCELGYITTRVITDKIHNEEFPCQHNKTGYDVYRVKECRTVDKCDSCAYEKTREIRHIHDLVSCNGH